MMTRKKAFTTALLLGMFGFGYALYPEDHEPNSDELALKATAEAFVKVVDENDAEALKGLLHPDMIQYAQLGEQLIPFKASDFIQMVADKKLGGIPRKVTHLSARVVRGSTALVVTNAVSSEYDFMYQLSMAKTADGWVIVGILSDIKKIG